MTIEQELERYTVTASPELGELSADDRDVMRRVIGQLMSDARTGAWLPEQRQRERIAMMAGYPVLHVARCCTMLYDMGLRSVATPGWPAFKRLLERVPVEKPEPETEKA